VFLVLSLSPGRETHVPEATWACVCAAMLSGMFVPRRAEQLRAEHSDITNTDMLMTDETENLVREHTAELTNDPRFFTENVIDKRLAAFEALAIVSAMMGEVALKETLGLASEFKLVGEYIHLAVFQMIGEALMVSVMFVSSLASGVLSLQLFYTIRLMTASPTGFDKAARFYQDSSMWLWRERAINGVKYSLIAILQSLGFMLYVKIFMEGSPEIEHETEHMKSVEYTERRMFAWLLFFGCTLLALILLWLVREHYRVFSLCYSSLDICHNSLNRHLITYHQP